MEHPHTLIEKGKLYDALKVSHEALIKVLKHVRKDVEWNDPSPTLKWINKELTKARKL